MYTYKVNERMAFIFVKRRIPIPISFSCQLMCTYCCQEIPHNLNHNMYTYINMSRRCLYMYICMLDDRFIVYGYMYNYI